jgi:hypothetical protein
MSVSGQRQQATQQIQTWAESESSRLRLLSSVFRHHLGVRAAMEERALERPPGNGALARLRIVLSPPQIQARSPASALRGNHHCETEGPSRDHASTFYAFSFSCFCT